MVLNRAEWDPGDAIWLPPSLDSPKQYHTCDSGSCSSRDLVLSAQDQHLSSCFFNARFYAHVSKTNTITHPLRGNVISLEEARLPSSATLIVCVYTPAAYNTSGLTNTISRITVARVCCVEWMVYRGHSIWRAENTQRQKDKSCPKSGNFSVHNEPAAT